MDFFFFLLVTAILFVRPGEFVVEMAGLPIYYYLMIVNLVSSLIKVGGKLTPASLAKDPVSVCVLGTLGAIFLSHAGHLNFLLAREGVSEFSKAVLYYLLLVAVIDTPTRLRIYLAALVLYILTVTLLAVLQLYEIVDIPALSAYNEGWGLSETGFIARLRTTGIFNDPNDLSLILIMGIGFCAFLYRPDPGRLPRPIWLIPGVFFLYAVMLTQSRGGFLALLAAIGVLFYTRFGIRKAILLGVLIFPLIVVLFGGRQTTITTTESTGQTRIQAWAAGFGYFYESPIVGIGYNVYSDRAGMVAHNSYVHAFAELGFIGGFFFVGAFAYSIRTLLTLAGHASAIRDAELRQFRPLLAALVVGYAFGLLTLTRNYSPATYMPLGIVSAYLHLVGVDNPDLCRRAGPIQPIHSGLIGWMTLMSFAFLVIANIFIKFFVEWG